MKRIGAAIAVFVLGVSGIAGAQSSQDTPTPISVIDQTDWAVNSPVNVADLLNALPEGTAYRYANDIRGVPTLGRNDAPYAQPDVVGAGIFDPGTVGFGNTIDVIRGEATIFATGSGESLPEVPMAMFFSGRDPNLGTSVDEVEGGVDRFVQIDFVVGFEGSPGWEAIDAFPGDTWQGGSLILSAKMQPGEAPFVELIDANNEFASVPFSGFFAAGPDWMIAAVDLNTLIANGGDGEMRWAFGSHVHDGSYGACETCLSVINAYPPVPRTIDDLVVFPPVIPLSIPEVATTTTTSTTTTTTTTPPPATTITSPGDDPATGEDGTGGSFPWIPIGIGIVGIGGALLIFTKKDDEESPVKDCDPLLAKWKDLTRQRETAEEFLGSAYENFQARQLFLMEMEATRDEYLQAQSGPRGGSGGLDMVKLDGQLIQYDDLQELIDGLVEPIADAQWEVERANEDVERRLATYNAALEAEEAARAEYEACVEAATAPPPPPPEPPKPPDDGGGTPPTTPPSPPSVYTPPVSSEPRKNTGCDAKGQPDPVTVPIGPAVKFKLYTDFDVIVTIDDASKHGSHEHGKAMTAGLKSAGMTLGTIGNILGGAGSGKSIASAASSFQTGKIVKGSLDGVTGTVTGLGAAEVIPSVPTSLPEAIAVGLAAAANLGALVAGKITEWMDDNVTVYMRPAYFYQVVSIQPTQIWECRGAMWECVTRVNVYTVGNLEKDSAKDRGPYSRKGDRERYKTTREISRLAARGRAKIVQSTKALAAWEKANPPGPCE